MGVVRNPRKSSPSVREVVLIWLASLAATAWVNAALIYMPPVWDAAPGVFAPAIFLYESGFDLKGLAAESGYLMGGANVHSLSIVTLLTVAVLWLTGGAENAIPVLHALQFIFTAGALTATYLMARLDSGRTTSGLIALAVLLLPVFRVQTGYLYTEVVGAALVVVSLYAWVRGRSGWAIAGILLACLDKSLGVPFAGALAVLIALDNTLSMASRIRHVGVLLLSVAAVEFATRAYRPADAEAVERHLSSWDVLWDRLMIAPDLLALLAVAVGWVVLQAWFTGKRGRLFLGGISARILGDDSERATVGLAAFVCAFIAFFLLAIQHVTIFIPLTRYYVWIIPLLLLIFSDSVRTVLLSASRVIPGLLRPQRMSFAVNGALLASIALSLFNADGGLYPRLEAIRKFSVAERSLEYLKYYDVQRYGVQSVARHDKGLPVFVTRGEYYYLSSPLMGYVSTVIKDVRLIWRPPYDAGRLSDYPSDFMLLDSFSSRFHGQRATSKVLRQARDDGRYEVTLVDAHVNGPYRVKLYRVRMTGKSEAIPVPASSTDTVTP